MEEEGSDNEIGGLFATVTVADLVFVFEDIIVDEQGVIHFHFSINSTIFKSTLHLGNHQEALNKEEHYPLLFPIGMCVLLWYWMGFGSKRIQISNQISSLLPDIHEILLFWTNFYNNIMLEYMYINHLDFTIEIFTEYRALPAPIRSSTSSASKLAFNQQVLVPIGGGKDSLVVWHLLEEQGLNTSLLYVADGPTEYEESWRIQQLLRQTARPFTVIKHMFHYESIEQYAVSYLKREGHPWAALVMFDALLVV